MKPVTLITGASSGIGAELAHVFAEHGHELVLTARREAELEALASAIAAAGHAKPLVLPADLVQRDAVARLAAALAANGVEPDNTPAATTGEIVVWFGLTLSPPTPAPFSAVCWNVPFG